MTIVGSGLRDLEWSKFSLMDDGEVAVNVNITSGISLTIGSVSATVDSVYVQSGNFYMPSGNTYMVSGNVYMNSGNVTLTDLRGVDTASTGSGLQIVNVAESTVPTEVADGDIVNSWHDPFGRQISYGANLSQGTVDVSEVAPALIQTANIINLNAVGSATGDNEGVWVNLNNYGPKTIYYNFTSGTTGSMISQLEVSPDAGSTVYSAGSKIYVADSTSYETINEHHEFVRVITTFNEGGTLTATITGRGGE